MKIFKQSAISIAVLAAGLLSCSTAPKGDGIVRETKNLAAENTAYGNSYFDQARYDQALKFFTIALDNNVLVDNEPGIASSYNSLGKVLLYIGDVAGAEKYFLKARAISERISNNALIAQSINNLGEVFLQRGETDTALDYFGKALEVPVENKEKLPETAVIYHNTATAYRRLEDYQTALDYLDKAIAINTKLKKNAELAANHYLTASIRSKLGDYKQALTDILLALESDKIVENSPGIAKDLSAAAMISEKLDDPDTAYIYRKRAYMIFERLFLYDEIKKLLPDLIDYAAENNLTDDHAEFLGMAGNLGLQS